MNEYTKRARAYARKVVAEKVPACRWVKAACQRQLDDLNRRDWEWTFDSARAADICGFIEQFPHVEGRWKTKRIALEDWQCFYLTTIFGWVSRVDGRRRFRKALVVVARRNAKTTLAALIGLYLLCCDGEPGAQIYSAATTRDQAKISWRIAKRMAEREPEFRECFGVEPLAHSITVEQTGSFFQAISRDSKPAEGFSVHGAIIDELHAHKTREIFDVLDEATGSRRQPLVFIISTEGDNAAGIFAEQRAYAENILAGNHQDDSYFAAIYTLDKGDDWTDPAIWVKANPNIGVSLFEEDLRVRCKQAQKNPASQSSFLTKRCNVRVGAGEAYFNMLAWEHKCKDAGVQLEDFYGLPCQAYLDLASESDIAAKVLLFKRDEVSYVFGKWYLPEDSLERGNPNYDVYRGWADSGRIVLTPGSAIDFEFIERDLLEDARNFQLQTPACDQFQATYLATRLKAQGIELFKYGATVKNFSEPMKHLNGLILAGKIKHDGDPALTWMMGNVTARRDAKDNVFPRKTRDENKIDGAVALIAALGVRLAAEPEQEPGAFAVSF